MILVTQSKASTYPYAPTRQALSKKSKEKPRPLYFRQEKGHLKIDIQHPEWVKMLARRQKEDPGRILKVPKEIRDIAKGGKDGKKKTEKKNKNVDTKKKEEKKRPSKVQKKNDKTRTPEIIKASPKQPGKKISNYNNGKDQEEEASYGDDPEFAKLAKASYQATLEEQILKNDLNRFKIEQEKLKLKKTANSVMDFALGDFLFLGYMEKMNIELLGLCKKIEPIVDNLIKEKNTKGVLKRFNREFQNILESVKKAQNEDLEEWKGEE